MASYLGIDASLTGTGLCLTTSVGDVVRLATIGTGELRAAPRLAEIKRVADLFIPADTIFAAIEGYAYHEVGRVFELGEVGGVLRLLVHERNIPYVEVPPASLKKFATGASGASKEHMIAAAKEAGARPADDNQADAFFLARVASAFHAEGRGLKHRREMEVVRNLLHPKTKKTRRRPRRLVQNAL